MILMADLDSVTADDSVAFQAYVRSRSIAPSGGITPLGYVREGHLVATAGSADIALSVITDFGTRTTSGTVNLSAEGVESLVVPMFEELQEADITVAQVQIGDASAVSNYWALTLLVLPSYKEGER